MKVYAVADGGRGEKSGILFSVLSTVIYTELMDYILLITLTFCYFPMDISVNIYNIT